MVGADTAGTPSNGVVRPNVLTVLQLGLGSEGFPSMCSLTNLKLVASNNVRATTPIKRSAARKFALFSVVYFPTFESIYPL